MDQTPQTSPNTVLSQKTTQKYPTPTYFCAAKIPHTPYFHPSSLIPIHPSSLIPIKMFKFLLPTSICLALLWAACNDPKPTPAQLAAQAAAQEDPALAQLNALLEKDPQNDSLLYVRSQHYWEADVFDLALRDISEAMRLDSMRPAYYHLMADIYLDYSRPNDSKRAIDIMTAAGKKFPERIPTLLKLTEFHLILQQHSMALYTLDRILKVDPQNADAFFMAGRVALDKRDTTNAIRSLQKSVQADASNADAWYFLGRILSDRNNPVAVQYYDNAFRVDSNFFEALEFKGAFYKRRGDYPKAFEIYRNLIRRNPDYTYAYFDMGMMYLDIDSLTKAHDNFDIAIKTAPLFVKAYYYRGVANELQGKTDQALADYVQANKMSPNYPEAKEARDRLEKKGN